MTTVIAVCAFAIALVQLAEISLPGSRWGDVISLVLAVLILAALIPTTLAAVPA